MKKNDDRKTLRIMLAELRRNKNKRDLSEILEELGFTRRTVAGHKIETR